MAKFSGVFSIFIVASLIALSACNKPMNVSSASSPDRGNAAKKAPVSFNIFPDLPFPDNADVNMGKTSIFGSGDKWFGRLEISTTYNTNEMFDYFEQEMPSFGWQEITSVRGVVSTITYSRQNRIASVRIEGNTLHGSTASIIVSPTGAPTKAIPNQNDPSSAMPSPVQRLQ